MNQEMKLKSDSGTFAYAAYHMPGAVYIVLNTFIQRCHTTTILTYIIFKHITPINMRLRTRVERWKFAEYL